MWHGWWQLKVEVEIRNEVGMKKWFVNVVYYISIVVPCLITCWTLCFGSPDSTSDKIVLAFLAVVCVACNAVLRHSAVVQNEAQNSLALEQAQRIRYLQCHIQPTTQMIRETALRVIRFAKEKGFENNCDISTRDFTAIASFSIDGSISRVERFMRMEDFEIAEFYVSDEIDIDEAIRKFMFEDVPFPCGDSSDQGALMRRIGRFVLKVAVPLYGVFERCFFDEKEKKIWIMAVGGKEPVLTVDAQKQSALIGVNRWSAYATVMSWCSEAGLLSLRELADATPFSRWH